MSNLSPHEQFILDNKARIEQDRKLIKEYLCNNHDFNFGNSPPNPLGGHIGAGLVFKKNWTLTIYRTLPENFNLDLVRVGLNNLNTNWPIKINKR